MKKKILLVITALLSVITLALVGNYNTKVHAEGTSVVVNGVNYDKISTVEEITNGEYIIGHLNNYACGEVGTNKYISRKTVENEAIPYTFTGDNTNGFKIQNSITKEYFSYLNCSKNKLAEEPNEADACTFTFTLAGSEFKASASNGHVTGSRFLQYNATSGDRFALYTGSQKNIELYKKSDVKVTTYTVTFNTMGGNVLENSIFPENDTLDNLPVPEKDGYEFTGWFKEETLLNEWNPATDKLTSDITLYAKWIEAPYTKVNSLADIVSAEYYFSINDKYASSYENTRLQLSNIFEEAIKFRLLEVSANTYIISFNNNGVITYLDCNSKSDVLSTTDYNQAYKFTLSEDSNKTVLINGQGGRALCENGDYLRFYSPSTTYTPVTLLKIKGSEIDMNEENIKQISTKSSLKITYDTTTLEATDIDLRFGTIIPTNLFNTNAKYGVVVAKKTSNTTFVSGLQTEADINSFVSTKKGVKYVETTPADVANGKQFAWVINNIEEQELKYDETFVACVYMELDGKLYFAEGTEASVKSVANIYITDTTLNIPTNVIEVLKKLV